jgi:hypothetical protein
MWAGHVPRVGEDKVYRILMRKPDQRRLVRKPRRRWEGGIRMDLGEICWERVEWIHLAQDRDGWLVL